MDMSHIRFPMYLPSNPLKRQLKCLLGELLCLLHPGRAARFARGDLPAHLSFPDRMLIAGLIGRHRRQGTLGQLDRLNDWLWAGEQAVAFHATAEQRFERWWLGHHAAIVEPLRAALYEVKGHTLCEIGCGSGRILADLATRLPELRELVGIDMSAAQTELNCQRHTAPRLRFVAGDATAWIPAEAGTGWGYLTVAGVLELISRERLQALFAEIAQRKAPAVFALAEPLAAGHDLDRNPGTEVIEGETTFSHNYPHLLREAGFAIRWQREQPLDGRRHLMLVAISTGR